MKDYNYKNCLSLFGYAADVHRRSSGICQLCGCGRAPIDFDLWRQMTVGHLVGKSQGGYLKQIRMAVSERFPDLPHGACEDVVRILNEANTVSACSFCNSTTSRDVSPKSMADLLREASGGPEEVISHIKAQLHGILMKKRTSVQWKLKAIRAAFEREVTAETDQVST